MKVSGKEVADAISKKLQTEVVALKVRPTLAIILAGDDPSSRIYVKNKIKRAKDVGIEIKLSEFSNSQFGECLKTIQKLNSDKNIHGIIVQYPVYKNWDFDNLILKIDPKKDVDGFGKKSPFEGATALAVWEMLTAFAYLERFSEAKEFLKEKKIVLLGKGRTAGGPIGKLLEDKGLKVSYVVIDTKNPTPIIKSGDIIISATGAKNIINKNNLKRGSYVISVGVGKEIIEGKSKIYGDIKEDEVSKIAKLYCPTIGGIGPLTIVSLLKNVVESAKRSTK